MALSQGEWSKLDIFKFDNLEIEMQISTSENNELNLQEFTGGNDANSDKFDLI